jgi:hypothetical protein
MPRENRQKAIQAYLTKYSRKDIAKFWGKNIQAIHDLIYKLKKDAAPTPKVVEEIAEEIAPVLKDTEIYPFDLKIVKEISGEHVQDYIVKLVDLFDIESDLIVVLDLKRSGSGFFNIRIKVNTVMPARQFSDELISNIGLLPKGDTFLMSLCVKEKKRESQ